MGLGIKYQVITLTVNAADDVVQFSSMIRGNVKRILGVFFTCSEDNMTTPGDVVGDVSLSVNNRGAQPINAHVYGRIPTDIRPNQNMPYPLEMPAVKNSMVSGWYRDLGTANPGDAYPYQVKVYLKLSSED